MLFRNPSKTQTSLSLNINGKQMEEAITIKFLGITMTPYLNCNEYCKTITTRANKRIFQLWRPSNFNNLQESLLLLYKSSIRPLFLYANACWLNQLQMVICNMQKSAKQSTENLFKEGLHEESNLPVIRKLQIRLAKDYIKRTQKNKIET